MSEGDIPRDRPRPRKRQRSPKGQRPRRISAGISPRTLWYLVGIVVLVGVAWLVLRSCLPEKEKDELQEVELVDFAEDSTATVGLAGEFPPEGQPPLLRPLGIDSDGVRIFTALGDAGAIGVFTYRGGQLATLAVPAPDGIPAAYPVDVAHMSDGGLAVVDTASNRVIVLDPENPFAEVIVLGAEGDAPEKPTAVAATEGSLFVADGGDKLIKEYEEDGTFVRAFGRRLDPRLTFVGGLHANDGMLYVSDSNASRVLVMDIESGRMKASLQERLGLPRGIATDDSGRIYVAEEFDAQVAIFDPTELTLVGVVGDLSMERFEAGGALSIPDDLFWDSDTQRLYVTDSAQGRVKVYNVRSEP